MFPSPMLRPRARARTVLFAALCGASAGACAATYDVTTAADDGPGSLRAALVAVAAGGASANDEVVLQPGLGTIVLASDLPAVSAASLIVRGNGAVVSGGGQYRGLAALGSGNLRIEDLAFTNTAAIGGDGGAGGGGGMGAGGAIFVGTFPAASNVTLVGVAATSSQARGGNGGLISVSDPVNNVGLASGGGGGMGGGGGDGALNGTRAGGGGGFGRFAFGGISSDGQNGTARAFGRAGSGTATSAFRGGFFGGGGGGGDSSLSTNPASGGGGGINAGNGGFFGGFGGYGGGGGGSGRCTGGPGGCGNSGPGGFGGGAGSTTSANAGSPNGGFGGGGGVGGLFGSSGFGGYGAGRASPGNAATRRGGGGLGAGGGAFVQQGSSLRFEGSITWTSMSAAPGVSAFPGEARGLGAAIFLHGNDDANGGSGRLRFSPATGATQTISDSIDDQGSFGGGGAWTPLLDGDGTLELFGSNSVAGIEVSAGTLRPASDASLGRPTSPLRLGSASLHPLFPGFSSARPLQLSGLGRLEVDDSMTWSGVISGAGTLVKRGAGTLLVDGASSSAGAVVVEEGVLRIDGNLPRDAEVQGGATLAGSGTVGAVTALPSSRIEPGLDRNGVAALTTAGLDLRAGSALALAFLADGSSDHVTAPQVTLGGALALDVDAGFANTAPITLIENVGASPVAGTFDLLPEGATVSLGAQTRFISYRGGDGNDVVLVSASAPVISSASSAQWIIGTARVFDIVAEGQPAPSLSIAGALPQGITFAPESGRLEGTAAAGTAGAYELTITASNGIGSDAVQVFTLSVVRAAQSITFDAPADRDFALAPFELQGSASSGLDVEYASQTPATCFTDARSLAMFSAGTCTLTASQPGDTSFEPAAPVQRSFQIAAVLPGAPRNGNAVKIDPVFALLFDPPESNGGIAIEGYRATCQPGELEFTGSDAPLELTALMPGPTYLCAVQARNALGFGPASATIAVPTQDAIFGDGFE